MQRTISRRKFISSAMAFAAITAAGAALGGCSGSQQATSTVRIGTMPTEDMLPMWVAAGELQDDIGVQLDIVSFDSAQNLSAAITAGEVDLAMTDPMRAVKLVESGTDVIMEWVTLGTDASQGRFGVLAPETKEYRTLSDFAGYLASADFATDANVGVGVGANTVPEYVFDKLCEQSGIDYDSIPHVEVASLPERYSLVAEGKLMAAALPNSMLTLGEASGLQVIADDTQGDNISQSVMVARAEYAAQHAADVAAVADAWDAAATLINVSPENYRQTLIDNANLNDAVADSYPISVYPPAMGENGTTGHPSAALVDPVIAWMQKKGYVEGEVAYNESDGTITVS